MNGTITTVDGLFMSIILLALSGILFLNVYLEARKKFTQAISRKRRRRRKRADVVTQSATLPAHATSHNRGLMLPAFTLWWRELVRFYRQRARVVGVIASPLVFWVVIGSGFGSSFRSGDAAGQQHYLDYFYPGALIMIVLFTSIFTMMSVIEDRKEGFLLSVLVAPVPRSAIVLGKVLGRYHALRNSGSDISCLRAAGGNSPGVQLTSCWWCLRSFWSLLRSLRWDSPSRGPMDSTQAFHAIINLFLIPLWLLSGALFPLAGASGWIRFLIRINPLDLRC